MDADVIVVIVSILWFIGYSMVIASGARRQLGRRAAAAAVRGERRAAAAAATARRGGSALGAQAGDCDVCVVYRVASEVSEPACCAVPMPMCSGRASVRARDAGRRAARGRGAGTCGPSDRAARRPAADNAGYI